MLDLLFGKRRAAKPIRLLERPARDPWRLLDGKTPPVVSMDTTPPQSAVVVGRPGGGSSSMLRGQAFHTRLR